MWLTERKRMFLNVDWITVVSSNIGTSKKCTLCLLNPPKIRLYNVERSDHQSIFPINKDLNKQCNCTGITFFFCPFSFLHSIPPLFVPFIVQYFGQFLSPSPSPSALFQQTKPSLSADMLRCEDKLWVTVSWNALKIIWWQSLLMCGSVPAAVSGSFWLI